MASQDHLVVAIVAGQNQFFSGPWTTWRSDYSLLSGSSAHSLAVRSFLTMVCDGSPSAQPLLPKRRVSSGVFPCWRWSDGAVRFKSSYNKRGGNLVLSFLPVKFLVRIVQNSIVVSVFVQFQL